jgi:hypothetical protein
VAIWYIRRERAKTRANTKKFGDQMDTADVHKRAAKMDDDVRDMGMTVPRAESEIDIEAEIDGYNTFDKIPMKRFPPTPSKSQRPLSPGSGASEEQPEPPSAKYPYFTPPGTCDSIDLLPSPNFRHHSGYGESILNGYTQPEGLRASSKGAAMYSTTLYPPRPQAPAQVTSPAVPYSHAHLFQTVQAQHTGLSSPSVYSPFPTEGAAFRVPGRPETFGLSPIHSSRDLPVPLAPDHTNTLLHSQGLR